MTCLLQQTKCTSEMEIVAGPRRAPCGMARRAAADGPGTQCLLCPASAGRSPLAAKVCWLCPGNRWEVAKGQPLTRRGGSSSVVPWWGHSEVCAQRS